jgi:carboxypeptidase Q
MRYRARTYFAAASMLAAAAMPLEGVRADATDAQIAQIIDEGLSHSQALANASELMDGIGPRLTNSENFDKAAAWALAKFKTYGLSNIHEEPYPFGISWNLDSWSATMVKPRTVAMRSIPVAWSPPTVGTGLR